MDRLGERYAYMISDALKTIGPNANDVMAYIIEDVYIGDDKELLEFIKWLISSHRPTVEHLLEDQFTNFKNIPI